MLDLEARVAGLEADLEVRRREHVAEVEETHRQYRRDLVPLKQAVTVYRRGRRSR